MSNDIKTAKKESVSLGQKIRGQFDSSQFRNGSYSLAMIGIVLVIIILINLIIGQLPVSATSFDISSGLIYETGEITDGVLSSLNHDVEILVIAENDTVDSRIETFLERYAEKSPHISLSYRDPVLHPDVLTTYGVSSNTIVVSCEDTGKSTTVALSDMIQYDDYYLYYQGQYVEQSFDGEGLITSAIDYAAAEESNTIYTLSGHNEAALSGSVTEMLTKSNLKTESLNLMEQPQIPEDCGLLLINAPQTDLADDELRTIRSYLMEGNSVMLLRGVTEKDLDNFDALMEEFGLTMVNSYVGDSERFYQAYGSYFNFFPTLTNSSVNVSSDSLILVSAVAGMENTENTDDSIAIEKLMTTGKKALLQTDETAESQYLLAAKSVKTYDADSQTEENEDSVLMTGNETAAEETETAEESEDETESTEAAAAESEDTEDAKTESTKATLMVLTVPSMIDAAITDRYQNLENLNEFMNLAASFFDDVENISIPAKSLEITYNTVSSPGIWNALFIFIIPAFFIISGLYVWLKRRKA